MVPAALTGILICLAAFEVIAGDFGPGIFLLGIAAVILGLAVLAKNATEMAVTNKRVIVKTGLLRRKTIELLLSKIESIDVGQGLIARMLGYGSIVVRGTGGTREPFRKIRSPLEFRREVQQVSV